MPLDRPESSLLHEFGAGFPYSASQGDCWSEYDANALPGKRVSVLKNQVVRDGQYLRVV
jgi:hypothetical protein